MASIVTNGFRCLPGVKCQGTPCCRGRGANPLLGVGDYYRLSRRLNITMPEVWRRQGDVRVAPESMVIYDGRFNVWLGLKHEPCPNLNEAGICNTYEARPMACAGFPILDIVERGITQMSQFGVPCIQGVSLTNGQVAYAKALLALIVDEARLDLQYFWKGRPITVEIRNDHDFLVHVHRALAASKEVDPKGKSQRTQKIVEAAQEMIRMSAGGQLNIDANRFTDLLEPIMYRLYSRRIEEKFAALEKDRQVLNLYQRISEAYARLLESQSRNES